MARLPGYATLAVALLACGCGSGGASVPAACTQDAAIVARAITAAPRTVRLPDGSRLSDCLRHATSDADLTNVGSVLVDAAGRVEARDGRGTRGALELGYLAGAVEQGAKHTGGVASELVDRMGRFMGDATDLPPRARAAFARGLAAGRARG